MCGPEQSYPIEVSLRIKLSAAVGVALVILLVGVASLYALRQSAAAAAAVQHSELVRVQLERALTTIVNAETGQRGYLLTQDSTYLLPYQTARTDMDHEIATIRELTADEPLQQSRVDSLALVADAKLVTMNESVVLTQSGRRDSALKLVQTGLGADLTNRARKLIQAMEATEATLLQARTDAYNNRKLAVILVTVIGSLLGATLSIITMLWLRTGVKQLEDTRTRFEQLLESTDEGVYGIDANGACTFINSAGARMLGYERKDLLGRNAHDVLHHHRANGSEYPVEECPIYVSLRNNSTARISDEVFWSRTQHRIPVEYTSSPIVNNGRTVGAVIAFSDITTRRRAERERERLIAALARSNRELDQFAYVASHDLKAPLRGIANLSQWIEEDLGEGVPPDVAEKMTLVRGRVQRLEALIDGILQYSRAGRVRTAVEEVDVDALLHEIVELLAPPPEVSVTIGPNMPVISTERTPLQQVFMNLINNAIKYNKRPGATVNISVRDAGGYYAFSVADNGPGIEPQYHERIFGIFQTLESRDKVEGTGIGLSVVKKTVELHGGSITVDSALGEGATFTFEWPKVAEENAAA